MLLCFLAAFAMVAGSDHECREASLGEVKAEELSVEFLQHSHNLTPKKHPTFPPGIQNEPLPEMLEHEYALPPGSGCGTRPNIPRNDLPRNDSALASSFLFAGNPGWNAFCEIGWTLCPDAVANQDYSYYWRGLGPKWVNTAGSTDSQYCLNNGWLKPEIARIVRNFTALKAKGEELCQNKYREITVDGEVFHPYEELTTMGGVNMAVNLGIEHKEKAEQRGVKDYSVMDEEAAAIAAAWNCALGDVSCDIAYCNYAYCEKPDGTAGIMGECEGWDAVHGMKALYG